jgi:TolA-binding protein
MKVSSFHILSVTSLLLLGSCLRTTADIKKDQEYEQFFSETKQNRNTVAELTAQTKNLEEQIKDLNGQIEELKYEKNAAPAADSPENKSLAKSELLAVKAEMEELKIKVAKMESTLEEQQSYIAQSHKMLSSLTTTSLKSADTFSSSKKSTTTIDDIEKNYDKNQFDTVIEQCNNYIKDKGKYTLKCQYWIAESQRQLKKYDESLISLESIYSGHKKSEYAAKALYSMSLILKEQGRSELPAMVKKLQEEYPSTPSAKKAKKLLKD